MNNVTANTVILIDDDKDYIDSVSKALKRKNPGIDFVMIYSEKSLEVFLQKKTPSIFFAIVDNYVDDKPIGKTVSEKLNKNKINHIIISGNCSVELLLETEKQKHCINVFEKSNFSLTIFQLSKAVVNAKQSLIQTRTCSKNVIISIAQGIIMSRYNISKIEAKSTMQKMCNSESQNLKILAQRILDEHSFFC